jgi:hypothetical protein
MTGRCFPAPRDIYDGEPWSEMDIEDLKGAVAYGSSLEEVAEFLCRSDTPLDVAAKAKELGLTWQTGDSDRELKSQGSG